MYLATLFVAISGIITLIIALSYSIVRRAFDGPAASDIPFVFVAAGVIITLGLGYYYRSRTGRWPVRNPHSRD